MNKKYSFLLILFFTLIFQFGFSQGNYKIIDVDLKEKIEYDNAKKADHNTLNETNYIQVYFIYEVTISSQVEGKEKINTVLKEFKEVNNLESTHFDFNNNIWYIYAKHSIPFESIKSLLDNYAYRASNILEKYGIKD